MEWQKLYAGKKYMVLIILMLLLQMILFLNEFRNRNDEDFLQEDVIYAEQFKDNIQRVIDSADTMNEISIFSEKDAFSESNLAKTKEDFSRLVNVTPIVFDGRFLTVFFEFKAVNIFLLISAAIVAVLLSDKKSKGMQSLIRSSVKGREKMVGRRIGTLFLSDLLSVIVFYGSLLCFSALLYGSNLIECLGYPIQSLSIFQNLTWVVSIGEFLLIYVAFRCMILFLVSFIIWLVLYAVEYVILSSGILLGVAFVEYVIERFITANHVLAVLHYCNLYYLLFDVSFFTEYKNLNIFSSAVNKNNIIAAVYLMICILMLIISIGLGKYRYPCGKRKGIFYKLLSKMGRLWNQGKGLLQEHLSVGAAEYYKLLFMQKGFIVILIVAVLWSYRTDYSHIQFTGSQKYYNDFMEAYIGPPDEESAAAIEAVEEELREIDSQFEQVVEEYQKGEVSEQELFNARMFYESYQGKRMFLQTIQDQTAYLEELKSSRGIDGWYLNSYSYNSLFENEKYVHVVLLLLSVVLLSSGVFAVETRYNMKKTIRSSFMGRGTIYKKKMLSIACISGFLTLVECGLRINEVSRGYGIKGLMSPAQSFFMLEDLPVHCNMLLYLIGYYALRCFLIIILAIGTCEVSNLVGQRFAVAVMSVLSIILELGFRNTATLTANIGTIIAIVVVAGLVDGALVFKGYRKWSGMRYGTGNKKFIKKLWKSKSIN